MSDKKISYLLIDTSYLKGVGFRDPDFQKLLQRSQQNALKIFIPHIAWEERRTQLLEEAQNLVRKYKQQFDDLNASLPHKFLLGGLNPPTLNMWTSAEIEARSKEFMTQFVAENKIEVVPISSHHADRTWERYFEAGLPSTFGEDHKKNRNDIPDLWIFEAAIDKKKSHPGLVALCHDKKLSDALKTIDIRVFEKTRDVIDEIENSLNPKPALRVATDRNTLSVLIQEKATAAVPETELDLVLAGARERFKDLDTKILGYVGYLGTPSKDQLFALLSKSGVSVEIARNVTERLVIAGAITDTGNHYLSRNKVASDLAATSVEPEIIKRLEEI
jgi:hypothetical protein